jgi:hypothetical protein
VRTFRCKCGEAQAHQEDRERDETAGCVHPEDCSCEGADADSFGDQKQNKNRDAEQDNLERQFDNTPGRGENFTSV